MKRKPSSRLRVAFDYCQPTYLIKYIYKQRGTNKMWLKVHVKQSLAGFNLEVSFS